MRPWTFEKTGLVAGQDPRPWPVTARISQIDLAGGVWCLRQVREHFWPAVPQGAGYTDATLWLLTEAGGGWVMWPADFFRSGQYCRQFPGAALGDVKILAMGRLLSPLVEAWDPKPGELVGLMVSTPAVGEFTVAPTVQERSGVVFVEWPADFNGPSLPIVAREEELAAAAVPAPTLEAAVARREALGGAEADDPAAGLLREPLTALEDRLAVLEAALDQIQERVTRQERQLAAAIGAWTKAGA